MASEPSLIERLGGRSGFPALAAGFSGTAPMDVAPRGRSFTRGLAVRGLLLALALAAFAWTLAQPGLAAARLLAGLLTALAGAALWNHVRRTNLELARFVEALAGGDLSQGFRGAGGDGGFGELGRVLDDTMRRLRIERGRLAEEARFAAALMDAAPTALVTVDGAGRVHLVNKSARRLFGDRDGLDREAFLPCGAEFVALLDPSDDPLPRTLVPLAIGGMPQRAAVSVAALSRTGSGLRLVAVEPIQHELAQAEIAAQSDLVRVLTHEIMNSLTPVTSLARTAATLMGRVADDAARDVADAKEAVAVLARRADALTSFVDSYRQFARVPDVRRRRFAAAPWLDEVARLFAAAAYSEGVTLAVDAPADLLLDADPDLLAQALINLLKNAAEAAGPGGRVRLIADGAGMLAVEDDGPGFAPGQAADMFLPFFTTKPQGTGVGLSVARQIVVAHGGTIRAEGRAEGGARLRIQL